MNNIETTLAPYAAIVIRLFQGVIYDEEIMTWQNLLTYQKDIADFFGRIGVELIINTNEGFALIRQPERGEESDNALPRLIKKSPLTYKQTVLCVILRESIEDFDVRHTETSRHFVTGKEIKDKLELFFKGNTNRVKLLEGFDDTILQMQKLDILKLKKEDSINADDSTYEVRRAIKAMISNEKLDEIKLKLQTYVGS